MNIQELFMLALMPVLKTLLIAVVGLFLALDRVSILTAEGRHHLNNLSVGYLSKSLERLTICMALLSVVAREIGAIGVWSYVYNIVRAYGKKEDGDVSAYSRLRENQHGETSKQSLDSTTRTLLPSSNSKVDEASVSLRAVIEKKVKSLVEYIDLSVVFRPPTIATIVGIIIASVSPIQDILVGSGAPLRFIESSVVFLGEAAIPSMTIIMGANLLRGFKRSGVGVSLLLGIIVVRFIVLPIIGVAVITAAKNLGMVGSDPLYHFVILLQYAVPPAMAIGTITQLFEIGETECSVIMFWNYAVASIALTLWCTYFMYILS